MKRSLAVFFLVLIFLVTFSSRALVSFQTDEFSYGSYFALRQIENINENGLPLFEDSLSYGGRVHLFPPVFYYLIAFFSFLGTGVAAKIIPNLLSSLVVVVIYFIVYHVTKKRSISLLSAFFSGFIPVFLVTATEISIYSLVVLLILLILLFIMKIKSGLLYLKLALLLIVILVFSHTSAFFLIIGLLFFLLLLRIESLEIDKKEAELILFASFLTLWFNFIIYKKAFLIHGTYVIWQNIPLPILTNYFFDLNVVQSIYYIGIVLVFLGIYAIYHALFKLKKKSLFLSLSVFLSILLLLWLKLIQYKVGLILMGLMLVILSSHTMKLVYSYLNKTKIKNAGNWFLAGLLVLFILTSVIPSFNIAMTSLNNVPSDSEKDAMIWLKENTEEDSVILARLEEGYAINYFAHRKTVIDRNFLMIEDAEQRYEDVELMFSLRLKTEVVRRLNKYDVDYIYFSGKFGDEEKLYYASPDCFELVYDESIKIYKVGCTIQ
ncbi:MAG: glycosyltransferase family 39 protein [archaeon]